MKPPPDTTPQRDSFLKEVSGLWPCIKGSLAEVRKPCARPNCPACRSGRKHAANILSYRQDGKVRCRYVPREWVEPLRQAIARGREVERCLAELSGQLLGSYRQQRGELADHHVGSQKSVT